MSKRAFRPRKRFGQNFLYDPAIAGKIVAFAGLEPGRTVVELGPGKGIMTRQIAETGARIIAVEIDRDLLAALNETLEGQNERVEILNEDLTEVTLEGLLASRGLASCVLMGNIPYNHTRDVLFSFLIDEYDKIEGAYLMVQREVGDRIVSPPGSRVYGITSVVLQSLYAVKSLFRVAPGSFNPPPKVASVVLEFKPLAEPLVKGDGLRPFVQLVKNLFQQRRKTIHNTIKAFYSVDDEGIASLQRMTGIDTGRRPESLSNEEFLSISRALESIASAG